MNTEYFLREYLKERPFFLSLIRAREAALFAKHLPFAKPVLDVGCGDGFFASVVSHRVRPSRLGSDPHAYIDVGLDVAGSRMEEARGVGVYKKLVIYDGEHFPFKDNTFATVISNCVLEHIPALAQVLKEMQRVLRPGGKAIVTVMAKPWEEHLVGSWFLGERYRMYMRKTQVHLNLFTYRQWRKAFELAGFEIDNQVGYLPPAACRLIDMGHYFSIPSLVTYKLFGKWVLWPGVHTLYPAGWLTNIIDESVSLKQAGAIFFCLRKSL